MTNFNGNFSTKTDIVYLGQGFPIFTVDTKMDKARGYGTAVKLAGGGVVDDPLRMVASDAGDTEGEFGGVIMMGVNYDQTGQAIAGKTELVATKGIIVVPIAAGLKNSEVGTKVYWDKANNNFKDSGTAVVGNMVSKAFKAKKLDGTQVDAAYISFGF